MPKHRVGNHSKAEIDAKAKELAGNSPVTPNHRATAKKVLDARAISRDNSVLAANLDKPTELRLKSSSGALASSKVVGASKGGRVIKAKKGGSFGEIATQVGTGALGALKASNPIGGFIAGAMLGKQLFDAVTANGGGKVKPSARQPRIRPKKLMPFKGESAPLPDKHPGVPKRDLLLRDPRLLEKKKKGKIFAAEGGEVVKAFGGGLGRSIRRGAKRLKRNTLRVGERGLRIKFGSFRGPGSRNRAPVQRQGSIKQAGTEQAGVGTPSTEASRIGPNPPPIPKVEPISGGSSAAETKLSRFNARRTLQNPNAGRFQRFVKKGGKVPPKLNLSTERIIPPKKKAG